MSAPVPEKSRTFSLDRNILTFDSSSTVTVNHTTDNDVLQAVLGDKAFPTRPEGRIPLGHIGLSAEADKDVSFAAGKAKVSFSFSGSQRVRLRHL